MSIVHKLEPDMYNLISSPPGQTPPVAPSSGILEEQNTQEATVVFQLGQLKASRDSTVYPITEMRT